MKFKIRGWELVLFLLVCSLLPAPAHASDFTELKIWTDKLVYKENEEIHVSVEPKDKPILVTYGEETKNVVGSTSFTAKYEENRLIAESGEISSYHVINVTRGNKLALLFDFSAFALVSLVMYRGVRSHARVPA